MDRGDPESERVIEERKGRETMDEISGGEVQVRLVAACRVVGW